MNVQESGPNRYMVSEVKRAHPGTGLNDPVFFVLVMLDALLTAAGNTFAMLVST